MCNVMLLEANIEAELTEAERASVRAAPKDAFNHLPLQGHASTERCMRGGWGADEGAGCVLLLQACV